MAGSVLNSTAVLRLNFCTKLNIYSSIFATSPICKPLAVIRQTNLKPMWTEKEFYRIQKREKIFYAFLILVWTTAIALEFTINFHNKYWIILVTGTVIYLYLKDIFTGLKWSEKLVKPKLPKKPSPILGLTNDEFEKYVEENYSLISEQEKSGYISLVKFCLAPNRQNDFISFLEKLRDYSQDEDYMTTLNYVMEYSDKQNLFFIMALDWKQDIETLEWRLANSLTNNFDLSIELPNPKNYGERASVAFDNIFEDFDKPLRSNGLQMGFIDTQSDEYVIFVHKIDDKEKVETAVNKIGYKYYEK